jgi:uncharacterized membrane protein (TIGR02234 family)
VALLLLGVVGFGMVFLAMRQGWAQVRTAVPAPLPTSVVTDSGESLAPYVDALAIAALASLAAVLATRRAARRVAGVLLAALGAGIAAAAAAGISTSAALAAASASLGSGSGSGAGNAPGSVTEGSTGTGSAAVPDVAGFHSRVVLTAASWQALAIVGALVLIAAGVLVVWRANRLPVMSSRYDAPTAPLAPKRGPRVPDTAGPDGPESDEAGLDGSGLDGSEVDAVTQRRLDSATMWESLSRGEDPTAAARRA